MLSMLGCFCADFFSFFRSHRVDALKFVCNWVPVRQFDTSTSSELILSIEVHFFWWFRHSKWTDIKYHSCQVLILMVTKAPSLIFYFAPNYVTVSPSKGWLLCSPIAKSFSLFLAIFLVLARQPLVEIFFPLFAFVQTFVKVSNPSLESKSLN